MMNLDKKAVQEVVDLFDIKYVESDDESSDTEEVSLNFSDLEGDISSVITNMEDKGEALEVLEEPVKKDEQMEEKVETVEDLVATSVEEAKLLTTAKNVEKAVMEEEFDSIDVVVGQIGEVDKNNDVIAEEALENVEDIQEDIQRQLSTVPNDPELANSIIASSNHFSTSTVLEDENVEIIPQKDSAGEVKGELKMKNIVDVSFDDKGRTIIKGGEIVWSTESPSELYDSFYRIKNEKINIFSGGMQLDFDRLYQELYSTSVDTSTEVLDSDILLKKLDVIVRCIDRVAMIQIQVNHQQFVWKRFVELLRGALARVQYLKPVLKQEGLQLEHMGDVEFYSERLNALKESAHDCMKNLEKAFEALSRKISVMLTVQGKHINRSSPNAYNNPNQMFKENVSIETPVEANMDTVVETPTSNIDLEDYDGFNIGTIIKPKPKAGEVDWGDV